MKKVVFLDTETTGNTEKDFLCQIAYKIPVAPAGEVSEAFAELYKPPKKIPPEASAVHHITNKMVADKPAFQNSPEYSKIKKLLEDKNVIVVAHNAPFDLNMLQKEEIRPKNFICTLRVARHLDRDEKIDRYNLQFLRYFLEMEVEAAAHDALGDVLVLESLFYRLKNKVMEEERVGEDEAIKKMVEISSHPSLLRRFKFGKHNGKAIDEVALADRGYLEWLLAEKQKGDEIDEDWIYTLKFYLEK